jgi:hypothetical protein
LADIGWWSFEFHLRQYAFCVKKGGQDIAEYATMLAVIPGRGGGKPGLIGSNANNIFPSVAGSIH